MLTLFWLFGIEFNGLFSKGLPQTTGCVHALESDIIISMRLQVSKLNSKREKLFLKKLLKRKLTNVDPYLVVLSLTHLPNYSYG